MKEVVSLKRSDCAPEDLCCAPCGGGLLMCPPARLQQLMQTDCLQQHYVVNETPFARGQFATVRECTSRHGGGRFAAKTLKKRRRQADIQHEIAVLYVLAGSQHIVQLHHVFQNTTDIVLVLELAEGGDLQTVLDGERCLSEQRAACVVKQILSGLQALHALNIAHLDLKPQNILLSGPLDTGQVKLCDFGMSRLIERGSELREIMGTADYMAPEILGYEPLSLATDMWSVGVVTYVVLSGFAPFSGDTSQETYCNISSLQLDFPDQLFSDVSDLALDFICRLLVKNPRERMTVDDCFRHPWISQSTSVNAGCALVTAVSTSQNCGDKLRKDSGISSPGVSDAEDDKECDKSEIAASSRTSPAVKHTDDHHISQTVETIPSADDDVSSSTNETPHTVSQCMESDTHPSTSKSPPSDSQTQCDSALQPSALAVSPSVRCYPIAETSRDDEHEEQRTGRLSSHSLHPQLPPSLDRTQSQHDPASAGHSSSSSSAASSAFCYRQLSVARLTDTVWDCFDVQQFRSLPFLPWQAMCSGVAQRARASLARRPSCASLSSPSPESPVLDKSRTAETVASVAMSAS